MTLQDANPLLIIGVYYYANDVEDPETMWQLLNHEYNPISFEAYVENWTKEEAILEQVESIFVDIGDGSINGSQLAPVGYEKNGNIGLEENGSIDYFARVLFDNDSNIWTIYELLK